MIWDKLQLWGISDVLPNRELLFFLLEFFFPLLSSAGPSGSVKTPLTGRFAAMFPIRRHVPFASTFPAFCCDKQHFVPS
jgi:hypothetical protein